LAEFAIYTHCYLPVHLQTAAAIYNEYEFIDDLRLDTGTYKAQEQASLNAAAEEQRAGS